MVPREAHGAFGAWPGNSGTGRDPARARLSRRGDPVSGVSVLIVDDHEVVRVGLQSLLGRRNDLSVAGAVGSGAEAVSVAEERRPDVVVMDVRMPGQNGIEACREIRSLLPDTKVLMLTSYADEDAVLASILAGASGYLLKDTTGQDLAEASGSVPVHPSSIRRSPGWSCPGSRPSAALRPMRCPSASGRSSSSSRRGRPTGRSARPFSSPRGRSGT